MSRHGVDAARPRSKRRVWADSTIEWYGFEPVGYYLNAERVGRIALAITGPDVAEQPITFVDVLRRFQPSDLSSVEHIVGIEITAADGKYTIRGSSFAEQLLGAALVVRRQNENPFYVMWCYFGHDHVSDDIHFGYDFFVATTARTLLERVSFSDYSRNGFDPLVFTNPDDERRPIWSNDPEWRSAVVALAYRRFYTETLTGQLMVPRSDDPQLFYYDDPLRTIASLTRAILMELAGLRARLSLLLVGVVLVLLLILLK